MELFLSLFGIGTALLALWFSRQAITISREQTAESRRQVEEARKQNDISRASVFFEFSKQITESANRAKAEGNEQEVEIYNRLTAEFIRDFYKSLDEQGQEDFAKKAASVIGRPEIEEEIKKL